MYKSQLLSQSQYPYQVILRRRSWFDLFDSGVIVLSRHPVVKIEMEHFWTRRKWDRLACKGVIFCRIKVPYGGSGEGEEVDVYATHMQAGHMDSEQSSREQQTRQLCQFIHRHSSENNGRKVVLVGDMNMGPSRNADLSGYSVHYSSFLDAQKRVGTYELLKKETGLRDVICPGWEQDINRFLVMGVESADVEYLPKPKYDERRNLSDSERLVCRIKFPSDEKIQTSNP
jgi:endonuclease/exonuclease/phosphatase family metal-dependent hydrolase